VQSQTIPGVHLWLVMMKAYQAMSQHAEQSIEATGLCFSDFCILEILLHKGPVPICSMADKLQLTSGSLTAAIDRLEKKALVVRQLDAQDRRVRIVHLTETGRPLIEKLFAQHTEDMERATLTLDETDREQLISLLKKLGRGAARGFPKDH
jgi:MarR family 2-MHQ and catechol resistance regulon transcriptional repressor